MHQFFVDEIQTKAPEIIISGADHNHIKNVLRMKPGERLRISTGTGRNYFARISRIEPESTRLLITEEAPDTELPIRVTLYQGLPKGDKMEQIIQKTTELGVFRIVPVIMKNCVAKLDEKKAAKKTARWQSIAESAAKQSKRSVIPEVEGPKTFAAACAEAGKLAAVLVPYENAEGMSKTRAVLGQIAPGDEVGIFIGPEGGFSLDELTMLPQEAVLITLGKRILRTETAGPAVLAMTGLMVE